VAQKTVEPKTTSKAGGTSKSGESPKGGTQKSGSTQKPTPTPKPADAPAAAQKGTSSLVWILAAICGAISAIYSAYAFWRNAYTFGFFSILGYLLDTTWSLLNTFAGMFVWVPACLIIGANSVDSSDDSQRSGTLVFDKNPRGANFDTTIGTVIAGKWSSHEETHVWQARIFGPAYLPVYGLTLLLNMLFRLVTGHTDDISMQAYRRVCFEDWAYSAGRAGSNLEEINWGMWFLWLLLTTIYVGCFVLIAVGIADKSLVLALIGVGLLVVYDMIRTFTPPASDPDDAPASS